MFFHETKLKGAFVIELDRKEDARGFFARTFARKEFEQRGLNPDCVQSNISYNKIKGTFRGMHYQVSPYAEVKLIRCSRGCLYDVIIDLRSDSPTFKQWFGIELSERNFKMLYIPEGFAHGFISLEDETDICYQVSKPYAPGYDRGVRYNDPAFGIQWPAEIKVITDKDKTWPDFKG